MFTKDRERLLTTDMSHKMKSAILVHREVAPHLSGPFSLLLHDRRSVHWDGGSASGEQQQPSQQDIFAQIMIGLAAESSEEKTAMIDATYLEAHRTATRLAAKKGGAWAPDWPHDGRDEHQTSCGQ